MTDFYRDRGAAGRLTPESRFRFGCHAGLACFGQCCWRPTIILHPYDILRLKRRLGLSSSEFLIRYTRQFIEEQSQLPLVLLDLAPGKDGGCPFFHAGAGCGVYPDRPAACRLFPVTQGSAWADQGPEDFYFLRRLDFCRGFDGGNDWTVASWEADQEMAPYHDLDRDWKALLLALGREGTGPADARGREFFFLAVYDLDEFRQALFRQPARLGPEPVALPPEDDFEDDVALLRFGYQYLRKLFSLNF